MTALDWHGQLSHLAVRSPDVDRSARYYCDVLGLTEHWRDGDQGHIRLGWGTGQHALDLIRGTPELDHCAIEIPEPAELEALLRRIERGGVSIESRQADDGQPESFVVADPDGRRLELHGRVNRAGEHAADSGRRPVRLQHITFATPSLPVLLEFYVDVLGFRLSDRMGGVFAWLRCGAEHHTVAMVEGVSERMVDHYSFDLDSWQDFKVWCDRLSERGVPIAWGPGRHGPGNNLFVMFDDPDGYHVELSSEMERYFDDVADYEARSWDQSVKAVNLWGTVPEWRRPQTDVTGESLSAGAYAAD